MVEDMGHATLLSMSQDELEWWPLGTGIAVVERDQPTGLLLLIRCPLNLCRIPLLSGCTNLCLSRDSPSFCVAIIKYAKKHAMQMTGRFRSCFGGPSMEEFGFLGRLCGDAMAGGHVRGRDITRQEGCPGNR